MKNSVRYFIAIILIGIGVMLVLDNIGVVDSNVKEAWHYIYPSFFVFLGIVNLYRFFIKGRGGWMFSSFLLIFGTLLLLGKFEVIPFVFSDILKLWPLLIIYIGFSMIGKKIFIRKPEVYINGDHTYAKERFNKRFSVGNFEYKQPNWKVTPMELRNIAGDYYFDFTKAFIPEEEIPISINSLAGDIQILLPEDIEFRIEATVRAGEINILGDKAEGINRDLLYETPNYHEAVRKLDIYLNLKAGSIRVNKV